MQHSGPSARAKMPVCSLSGEGYAHLADDPHTNGLLRHPNSRSIRHELGDGQPDFVAGLIRETLTLTLNSKAGIVCHVLGDLAFVWAACTSPDTTTGISRL